MHQCHGTDQWNKRGGQAINVVGEIWKWCNKKWKQLHKIGIEKPKRTDKQNRRSDRVAKVQHKLIGHTYWRPACYPKINSRNRPLPT